MWKPTEEWYLSGMVRKIDPKTLAEGTPGTDRSGLTPESFGALRRRLLAAYDGGKRDLPWRRESDPYRIWVSEVMLQQTRVETVIPYYEKWIERFPRLEDLAGADEDEVLRMWQGLGNDREKKGPMSL